MFRDVPSQFDFPKMEKDILAFWDSARIYEKSLRQRQGAKPFVFFEGPPTANGLPHPGHCLTRAVKDLFPRFKTMTGHYCLRKGGWDTHGLPVEVEVCKELGIHTKEEIEKYGVEAFNRKCLESVFRYTREWEQMTRRLGFWVNLDEAYVTYHQSYVESVWWSLKQLFDADLLYQGHKIVWWWAQGGTALSAGEVGQGYREVDDPSVYVRFPLVQDERFAALFGEFGESREPDNQSRDRALPSRDRALPSRDREGAGSFDSQENPLTDVRGSDRIGSVSLLVWTTTPWTLPSNMFAAVNKDFDYAVVLDEETGERLIFAAALVEQIAKKVKKTDKWKVERTVKGNDLLELRYVPPFPDLIWGKAVPFDQHYKYDHEAHPADTFPPPYNRTWGEAKGIPKGHTVAEQPLAWRVLAADFVTLDSGTGLVHEAPAFGEVDFDLWKQENREFAGEDSIPLFNLVAPNGTFTDDAPEYCRGRWVKDCDKDIIRDLKERGLLLHQEQYRHDYPFCWRAEDDPLIQYPRKSWFIRTTKFKDAMLENNAAIHWLPEHIKEGRFGKFLESNVDWSLSRERYWGTPLPIWVCESCGHMEAVDSYEALTEMPGVEGLDAWENAKRADPNISEHLKVHKPYIDAVTYQCPKCAVGGSTVARVATADSLARPEGRGASEQSREPVLQSRDREGAGSYLKSKNPLADARGSEGRMRRVPEVIDCWYDSGAMPFAQWGYPHRNAEMFAGQYPADFISEALDQTRGWFYSLVAIGTLLFGKDGVLQRGSTGVPPAGGGTVARLAASSRPWRPEGRGSSSWSYPLPFRNCIVLGLLMGEDGLKMSKSKKNYKEPSYIFEHEGADAMRWLFFSGQAPWTSIRFQESAIAEAQREFLIRLYNCYSFFVIYANIDGWTPQSFQSNPGILNELDRWILSELAIRASMVHVYMERFDNFMAAQELIRFVDALSNWYVRRSRDRFWKSGMDDDKRAAYATLYRCLVTVSELLAPFCPFLTESMYQNLVKSHDSSAPISVHLCNYPVGRDTDQVDRDAKPISYMGYKLGTSANEPFLVKYRHHSEGGIPIRPDDLVDVDFELTTNIERVRQLVSCGRAARAAAKLRVRQPLQSMDVCHSNDRINNYESIIKDELNIKAIRWVDRGDIDKYVHYEIKPDFKKIGPKFGPLAPRIKHALVNHPNPDEIAGQLQESGVYHLSLDSQDIELTAEELFVELHAKEGWAAERIPGYGILVLDTHLTEELRDEGVARDFVNQVQQTRKGLNLRYEQRIDLAIVGGADVQRIVNRFTDYIRGETLAQNLLSTPIPGVAPVKVESEGHAAEVYVKPL